MYEEYEELITDTEQDEDKRNDFIIDDVGKADWAINKINEEQCRFALFEQATNNKIDNLKAQLEDERNKLETKTSFLKFKLNDYLDTIPAKTTKTKKYLKLPSGTITRKFATTKIATLSGDVGAKLNSNEKLIKWCKDNGVDVIKATESVDWSTLKNSLVEVGDNVVYSPTGEICDVLQVINEPIKVEVKE